VLIDAPFLQAGVRTSLRAAGLAHLQSGALLARRLKQGRGILQANAVTQALRAQG